MPLNVTVVVFPYTSKKQIKNNGQREQVYIEGHHEPIVDPALFDEVQRYIDAGMLNGKNTAMRKAWFTEHPEIQCRRESEPLPIAAE